MFAEVSCTLQCVTSPDALFSITGYLQPQCLVMKNMQFRVKYRREGTELCLFSLLRSYSRYDKVITLETTWALPCESGEALITLTLCSLIHG
jgi:hypothetical protein